MAFEDIRENKMISVELGQRFSSNSAGHLDNL